MPHHARSLVMATKSKSATNQSVTVTLRRLGKPAGSGKVGEYILVVNPKVFGSTGDNWLGGKSFPSRDAALAAAPRLGGRVS